MNQQQPAIVPAEGVCPLCRVDVPGARVGFGDVDTAGGVFVPAVGRRHLDKCPHYRAPRLLDGVTLELSEEDRQLVLLALAVLSLESPGFDDALNRIALRIDNEGRAGRAMMFDAFREARRDQPGRPPRAPGFPACTKCGTSERVELAALVPGYHCRGCGAVFRTKEEGPHLSECCSQPGHDGAACDEWPGAMRRGSLICQCPCHRGEGGPK